MNVAAQAGRQRRADQLTMVYHVPYPLQEDTTRASAIRPLRMRQAFAELGVEVLEISGRGADRARACAALRARLRAGQHIDLAYSESSTLPTLLTESHHLPTHPVADLGLLELLHRYRVPTGLFYRDVYWAFPEYRERVGRAVASLTVPLYHLDLAVYSRTLTRLYLPSEPMAPHVPGVPASLCRALPPGCTMTDRAHRAQAGQVRLFYVGGLGAHYGLQECVRGVARTAGAHLVLCTRQAEWEAARSQYEPLLGGPGDVSVVHESGDQLAARYQGADVAVLFTQPQEYRDFAAPMKLFEAIGQGIPVLASAGTLVGQIVEREHLGWTIPYDAQALSTLLAHLAAHPGEIDDAAARVRAAAPAHTWLARAAQVVEDLTGVGRDRGSAARGEHA